MDGISHGDQETVVRFRFSQGDIAESQIVPSAVAKDVVQELPFNLLGKSFLLNNFMTNFFICTRSNFLYFLLICQQQ